MKIPTVICSLILSAASAFGNFAELVRQGDKFDAQFKAEAALQYYLPAEKLKPDDAALLVKIARQFVYRMSELSSKADQLRSGRTALGYAERAVKLAPNECDSHLALAICLGKLTLLVSDREGIEASRRIKSAAEMAVKLNPKNDYAWHLLGRWHQAMAQMGSVTRAVALVVYGGLPSASYEEAVRCFQKANSLNPARLMHVVELGRTYAFLGREEEARNWINRGLAMPEREKDDAETKQRGRKTLKTLG
jgi:tetratricopeptide (TPR) repeat protein